MAKLRGVSVDERKAATTEAFASPAVGDVYSEMYSYWVFVVAVDPSRIAVLEASGPCELPRDGKLRVFYSHDDFRKVFTYKSRSNLGYWVMLDERGANVEGWFAGWPQVQGPPDCTICAASLAVSHAV